MAEDAEGSKPTPEKYSRREALKLIGATLTNAALFACQRQNPIQSATTSSTLSEKAVPLGKGELVELPKDIMDEDELARRGIKITNLSSYDFYLRKSAVELPVIRRDRRLLSDQKVLDSQGRRSTFNKAILNIVLFDGVILKRQELDQIQDISVKNDLLNHGLDDFNKNRAGLYLDWNEFKESKEVGSIYDKKIYILICMGGNSSSPFPALASSDDLPRLFDLSAEEVGKTYGNSGIAMKKLGVWLSLLFRHEAQHYSSGNEEITQNVAVQSLKDAEKRWDEKGEDTGYYFVIRDRRSGIIIRANAEPQTQKT